MEIKSVADLVAYRQSLKELWGKEEFQPVLAFLSSMKEEGVNGVRAVNLKESAEDVKAVVATLKTQINFAHLLLNLPEAIRLAEEAIEKQDQRKLAYMKSQEGGSL